ncbi:MAG: Uma2 family endonuclease [Ideonella sp.]|nr:Uma2 family endonuclease [Ideonella sp.]
MGQPLRRLSLQEFIAWENEQLERHEFVRGEVFAMVGGRRVHGRASLNVAMSLGLQLKGSPCQVFSESMKVQVGSDAVCYPDVFVTCDPRDLRTDQVFKSPTLIVEVLSPSTQAYDRGIKFTLYRALASLREYLLVDPETRELQLFRRGDDGLFTLHDLTGREEVELRSIGCRLMASDIFEGIDLPDHGFTLGDA